MEFTEMTTEIAGRTLKFSNGPIRSAASGYVTLTYGGVTLLANATITPKGRDGADFFPMVVDYQENFFAAGKIKGSRFVKRAGRPSEKATLTSRLIDRPMRPLFPKGTTNEVQVIVEALSVDNVTDPATDAINAASTALLLSGAPFDGPVAAVRMGYQNGELIVNPTIEQCDEGEMNFVVAGTMNAITMVEAGMKEIPEEVVLQALEMAHKTIKEICQSQIDYAAKFSPEKVEADIAEKNQEAIAAVEEAVTDEMIDDVKGVTKKDVKKKIHALEDILFEKYATQLEEEVFRKGDLAGALNDKLEKRMRQNILEKELRLDGRKLDEVRPVSVYVDVLERTHGSAIFQRGETQALTITTLGAPGDAQIIDTMEGDEERRYFHHYSFPPYSVGEVRMLRSPGRREIGHGDLAERALVPVLPSKEDFPYTIWAHSLITSCNGSSSMASVCGSTLSLMAAGVPIKAPVVGIAMGLVSNKETGDYKILTDIQGMEDFAGDMDFKVTGTDKGLTALQMDIKLKGLSLDLMREALGKAKNGRDFIMEKMISVLPENRKELSKYAPLIMNIQIDPDMIRNVIGKGGETIQAITKECEVEMDISDEGLITVTAPDQERGQKAIDWVNKITYVPKVGDVFEGKVVRIMDFGAFVEISPGKDGLVHISQLSNQRVNKVEDVVKMGDKLKVKLMEVDSQGRYNLSHKAVMNMQDSGKHDKPRDNHGGPDKSHQDTAKSHQNGPAKTNGSSMTGSKGGEGEIVPGTHSVRKVNGQ